VAARFTCDKAKTGNNPAEAGNAVVSGSSGGCFIFTLK